MERGSERRGVWEYWKGLTWSQIMDPCWQPVNLCSAWHSFASLLLSMFCFLSGDFSVYILLACYIMISLCLCPACLCVGIRWDWGGVGLCIYRYVLRAVLFILKKKSLWIAHLLQNTCPVFILHIIYSRFSFLLTYKSIPHDLSPLIFRRQQA